MTEPDLRDLGAVIIMPPPPPPAIVRTVNLEDAAFESQHPRGAGGRFTAKSKSDEPTPLVREPYLGERMADPAAQAFVDRTVSMLRRLGFNVPRVVVTTIPDDTMKALTGASQMAVGDEAAAFAQPGRMVLTPETEAAFKKVEQQIGKWGTPQGEIPDEVDQGAMRMAVHELLHQVTSMNEWEAAHRSGDGTRFLDGAQTEEGVVEAVTLDVCNQWGRKWGITFPFYPPGTLVFEAPGEISSYKDRTVYIRKLSEKWAKANWRSKAATKWRRALLHADYAKRKVMIAEVERRGGVKLSEKNVSVRQYIRDGRLVRAHRRRLDVKAIAQTIDTESRLPRPGTVHVRRAGTADQEKTSYALSRLLDFHLIEPNDVQATFLASSWPTMRTYLEQIWREKDNPAHKTLPEEFRPGGKYRVPFRAAINPATIDRMDYILTKGRDRAADVLEKALSGKTVEAERSGRVPMIGPGWEPGEGRKMKIDLAVRAQYWANFYEESRAEVRHYSDEYGVDRDTVTAIIAAISPSTVWEARDAEGNRLPNDNMESARLIISDLSKYGEVRSDNPATWITEQTEQMKKIQTIWAERNLPADQRTTYYLDPLAVYFGTPSDQRKTINFAQNIYGDTQAVTIDRHMYNLMAEYPEGVVHSANEYDAMEQVIRDLSEDSGIEPSTVQAILWGYRREILNREDERAMTGRRREQTERLKETYPAMRRGRWAATIADIIAKKPKERRSISAAKRDALVADISRRFGIAPEMIRPQIKLLSDDLDGTVEDEILNLFEEAADRLRDPESDIFEMREAMVDIAILAGLAADKDGSEQTYRLAEPDTGALVLFGGPPVTEHENVVMLGEIKIPKLPRKVTRGILARMLKEADEPTLAFLAADLADSGSALRLAQVEAEIERRRVLEAFYGPDRERTIVELAERWGKGDPRGWGGRFKPGPGAIIDDFLKRPHESGAKPWGRYMVSRRMTEEQAKRWSSTSAVKVPLYHGTSKANAAKIKAGGMRIMDVYDDPDPVRSMYGQEYGGMWFTTSRDTAQRFANMTEPHGDGEVLTAYVRVDPAKRDEGWARKRERWLYRDEPGTWVHEAGFDGDYIVVFDPRQVAIVVDDKVEMAEWHEHLHPRGAGGKFAKKAAAIVDDYRGQHTAPDDEFGASLDQLDRVVDETIYTHTEWYYGGRPSDYDLESASIIKKVRGKPDAMVTMYRAVPGNVDQINNHDWVTLSRAYAQQHKESNGGPGWKILSKKVPARELWWNGDSINEFGWVEGSPGGSAMLSEIFQEHLHPRGTGGKFTRKFTVDVPKDQGGGRQEIEVEYREATDEDRKALKIPPAWTEVYVTDHPTHPLRAMGKDSKGRTQRRYSAEFLEANQAAKFERLRQFDTARESILKATANDNTDNAMVVRLIALTGVRPGSEKDTGGNKKAYGATTIQEEHVTLKGNKITLDFVGKEGIDNHFEVEDPVLAKWMKKRLGELEPGQQVFHGANDKSARAWMARNGGSGFLLKDFRTWIATATALRLVKEGSPPPPEDEKDFQRRRKEIGEVVSKMLNNTPQMALGNYISPAVFDQWRM